MIEVRGLTKRFGNTVAIDNLSFNVAAGRVTGFLGPNGAGKSTTMRIIVGLDRADSGSALVDGSPYRDLTRPLCKVGVLLDPASLHPGRTIRNHLRCVAASNALTFDRVDEVLDIVGLSSIASRRCRSLSLGMKQRLGIAQAIIGDPQTLIFDEPVNGLDPEGVAWVRGFLRLMAQEGKCVLVSSHLMGEMAMTADHLLVLGRGHLLADASVAEIVGRTAGPCVTATTPDPDRLAQILGANDAIVRNAKPAPGQRQATELLIEGLDAAQVGKLAFLARATLFELVEEQSSLEAAYMELTEKSLEFVSSDTLGHGEYLDAPCRDGNKNDELQ